MAGGSGVEGRGVGEVPALAGGAKVDAEEGGSVAAGAAAEAEVADAEGVALGVGAFAAGGVFWDGGKERRRAEQREVDVGEGVGLHAPMLDAGVAACQRTGRRGTSAGT